MMMLTFMVTSKGIAGVPRSSILVLFATLSGLLAGRSGRRSVWGFFWESMRIMDMGRSAVNLIGNSLATAVVARWEGEFDDKRARVFGTAEEIKLDLA